jgi:hypothetical protein
VALITMLLLRHWFASNGLVFTIAQDGRTIASRPGRLVGAALTRQGHRG